MKFEWRRLVLVLGGSLIFWGIVLLWDWAKKRKKGYEILKEASRKTKQLMESKEQLGRGAITQEEYEQKKKRGLKDEKN